VGDARRDDALQQHDPRGSDGGAAATPDAIRDLGGSLSESQWLLTANILPLAAFMVLGGRLGDLFGLKRVFLTARP
jgi:MFS family permease